MFLGHVSGRKWRRRLDPKHNIIQMLRTLYFNMRDYWLMCFRNRRHHLGPYHRWKLNDHWKSSEWSLCSLHYKRWVSFAWYFFERNPNTTEDTKSNSGWNCKWCLAQGYRYFRPVYIWMYTCIYCVLKVDIFKIFSNYISHLMKLSEDVINLI